MGMVEATYTLTIAAAGSTVTKTLTLPATGRLVGMAITAPQCDGTPTGSIALNHPTVAAVVYLPSNVFGSGTFAENTTTLARFTTTAEASYPLPNPYVSAVLTMTGSSVAATTFTLYLWIEA